MNSGAAELSRGPGGTKRGPTDSDCDCDWLWTWVFVFVFVLVVVVASMTFWPITTNYFRVPFLQRREFEGWLHGPRTQHAARTHLAHGKARQGAVAGPAIA